MRGRVKGLVVAVAGIVLLATLGGCNRAAHEKAMLTGRWSTPDHGHTIELLSEGTVISVSPIGASGQWRLADDGRAVMNFMSQGTNITMLAGLDHGVMRLTFPNGGTEELYKLKADGGWATLHEKEILLGPDNSKDIWTTSVYAYTGPNGGTNGGPGGGLDDDRLRIGGWGDYYVALIQFPADIKTVKAVTLSLFNGPTDGNTTPIYVNAVNAPWSWVKGDRLWWKDLPPYQQTSTTTVTPSAINTWTEIDVTDLYRQWASGVRPNNGILLTPLFHNDHNDVRFYSSDAPNPGVRPRLKIVY